ncbi:MAG: zinc-dependent metalloprotease, partial [Planctomycetes bacterium]|nr:zinc-dependent metalloprotease [Planctomycetota bacterium]
FKYRKPIRDGILEWNAAFEKAGIVDAIEVRQQADDADWDPEDVNYNTFRWITSDAGFAMGPSRVNPYTGQILDADIIFDADFLAYWKHEFETFTPDDVAAMTGGSLERPAAGSLGTGGDLLGLRSHAGVCVLNRGMARQMAFGAAAIGGLAEPDKAAALEEEMIMQGLKEVTMHEVGHTLGLRHNFKGSTLRALKDVNDSSKTRVEGMVASIMDYNPANIVPKGQGQGDYYPTTIGPYDYWAIDYGYRQFSGNEEEELKKLASRSGERSLRFATDEDTNGWDPDPESNRFDLGDNLLDYANQRVELMKQLIPGLVDRSVAEGEDYTKARKAFNVILAQYGQAMYYATRYVGGLYTSRSHKGDKDGRPPTAVVEPARQREALTLLEQNVFNDAPFQFPPELYNQLGVTNWNHWGLASNTQKDFPVHDFVLMWQERILAQLLSSTTLNRMLDAELKVPADQDALTAAELIQRLTKAIFAEVATLKEGQYSTRKPAISSLRRNLQRSYLRQLSNMALGRTGAPQDCQTIAYAELASLHS